VEEIKLQSHGHPDHHTHGKGDQKHKEHNKFYHEVSEKLRDLKELMIMGPGTARDEFKHHCENHNHKQLA